jgi:hypothetical protein
MTGQPLARQCSGQAVMNPLGDFLRVPYVGAAEIR